jgi:ketosteroid isomerase-like protein
MIALASAQVALTTRRDSARCTHGHVSAGGTMRNIWRYFFSAVLLVLLGIASCSTPRTSTLGQRPAPAPRAATAQPANGEEAVRQLIAGEGAAVVRQDIGALMDLWAEDAIVTDAKHTPDSMSDDATWRGKDAIRSRYVVLVFPGNPQAAGARDVQVQVSGDRASATSTTAIGSEVSQGGDRRTFVRREGRWWIESLTYNLEK